ncbi:hypothetical protein C8F04DRAFT_1259759 [Mycena alexandri]|uniref:Uncharacterized protein n=1 Tax=Mycena alexandri TaxID=1745969 RepID=A0AAD6SYA1_9AGAR|nr:hypothetical protein C8F04DRAFT_1259759 [Mycena alexandri]
MANKTSAVDSHSVIDSLVVILPWLLDRIIYALASYNSTSTFSASGTNKKKWWPLGDTKGWTSDAGWRWMLRCNGLVVNFLSVFVPFVLSSPRSRFHARAFFFFVYIFAHGVFGGSFAALNWLSFLIFFLPDIPLHSSPSVPPSFIRPSRLVLAAAPSQYDVRGVSRVGSRALWGRWSGTRSVEPPLTPASMPVFPTTATTAHALPRASPVHIPQRARGNVWGVLDGARGEGYGQGRRPNAAAAHRELSSTRTPCAVLTCSSLQTARCTKGGVPGFTLARRPRRCVIALAGVFGAQLVARAR